MDFIERAMGAFRELTDNGSMEYDLSREEENTRARYSNYNR